MGSISRDHVSKCTWQLHHKGNQAGRLPTMYSIVTVNELTILSNCSQGCDNRAVTNRCLLLCTRHLPTSAQQSLSKCLTFMQLLVPHMKLDIRTRQVPAASTQYMLGVHGG